MKKTFSVSMAIIMLGGFVVSNPAALASTSSFNISGAVFFDKNGNGLRESDEMEYISSARSCKGSRIVSETKIKVTAEKGQSFKINYYPLNYCGSRTNGQYSGLGVYYRTKNYATGTKLTLELITPGGWKSTWPNPIVINQVVSQNYADFAMTQEVPIVPPEKVITIPSTSENTGNVQGNPDIVKNPPAPSPIVSVLPGNEPKGKFKSNSGKVSVESHLSAVADFTQSLLAIADREAGIGAQVRAVALSQNNSGEKVAEEINAVENRSNLKTFLIGTDYKNIGALRSEMVRTRSQIEQLKLLSNKAEDGQNKADLQYQIQALEQEQANINTFITQNENRFSLFGWAVKLFQ